MKKLILSAALVAVSLTSFSQVGVGTTTPKAALDVVSTTGGFIMPRVADHTTLTVGADQTGMQVYNTTSNKIMLWNGTVWAEDTTGGSSKFVDGTDTDDAVFTSGDVGIGTTSPTSTFHINKEIIDNTTSQFSITNDNGAALLMGQYGVDANAPSYIKTHSGEDFYFQIAQAVNSPNPDVIIKGNAAMGVGGYSTAATLYGQMNTINAQGYGRMFVEGYQTGIIFRDISGGLDDNFGIFTDNGKFQITNGNDADVVDDAMLSTELFTITNAGDIGVGLSTPLEKFHMLDGVIRLQTTGGGGLSFGTSDFVAANPTWTMNTFHSENIAILTNAGPNNQRLGVGTSSPKSILSIAHLAPTITLEDISGGLTSVDNFQIDVDGGVMSINYGDGNDLDDDDLLSNTALTINNNGNIGIGATSPAVKLEVNGYIKVGSSDASGDVSPVAGMIRFNGTNFQGYNGTAWVNLD